MTIYKERASSKLTLRHGHLHQDEALLFQFVLHELLATRRILSEGPSLLHIQKLIGDLYQPYSPSHQQSGSLLKLYYYLSMLSLHFPKRNSLDDPLFRTIFCTTESAIDKAIACQRHFDKTPIAFEKSFRLLQKKCKILSNLIFKRITHYLQNENVLYFLLRRKQDFDTFYHKKTVVTIFENLFRGGMEEALEWISKQYRQRKFSHLLPLIRKSISN